MQPHCTTATEKPRATTEYRLPHLSGDSGQFWQDFWMGFRAAIVDLLPHRLWKPGNLFMPLNHRPMSYLPESWNVTEHRLHFCVADGKRTVEWDGREVARGSRTFGSSDD